MHIRPRDQPATISPVSSSSASPSTYPAPPAAATAATPSNTQTTSTITNNWELFLGLGIGFGCLLLIFTLLLITRIKFRRRATRKAKETIEAVHGEELPVYRRYDVGAVKVECPPAYGEAVEDGVMPPGYTGREGDQEEGVVAVEGHEVRATGA